jgi:hypothetical protein
MVWLSERVLFVLDRAALGVESYAIFGWQIYPSDYNNYLELEIDLFNMGLVIRLNYRKGWNVRQWMGIIIRDGEWEVAASGCRQ